MARYDIHDTPKIVSNKTGNISSINTHSNTDYYINEDGWMYPKRQELSPVKLDPKKTYYAGYDINGCPSLREHSEDLHLTKEKQEKFTEWTYVLEKLLYSVKFELKDESPRVLGMFIHGGKGSYKTSCIQKIFTDANVPIIVPDPRLPWYDLDALISASSATKVGILLDECDKLNMGSDYLKEFMDSSTASKLKIVGATTNDIDKCNLQDQNKGRPSRWLYMLRVPDADVNDSVSRHIKKICPEFKNPKSLAQWINSTIKKESINEDSIKHVVKESIKWGYHKHENLYQDKLTDTMGILNIELTVDPNKYQTPRDMTRVNVMNITPKELAERIVRWNTSLKQKNVESAVQKHMNSFVEKNKPRELSWADVLN